MVLNSDQQHFATNEEETLNVSGRSLELQTWTSCVGTLRWWSDSRFSCSPLNPEAAQQVWCKRCYFRIDVYANPQPSVNSGAKRPFVPPPPPRVWIERSDWADDQPQASITEFISFFWQHSDGLFRLELTTRKNTKQWNWPANNGACGWALRSIKSQWSLNSSCFLYKEIDAAAAVHLCVVEESDGVFWTYLWFLSFKPLSIAKKLFLTSVLLVKASKRQYKSFVLLLFPFFNVSDQD